MLVWLKISSNRASRITQSCLNLPESHYVTSAGVKGIQMITEENLSGGCFYMIQSYGKGRRYTPTRRYRANMPVRSRISSNRAVRIRHSRHNPLESRDSTPASVKGVNLMIEDKLERCSYITPSVI